MFIDHRVSHEKETQKSIQPKLLTKEEKDELKRRCWNGATSLKFLLMECTSRLKREIPPALIHEYKIVIQEIDRYRNLLESIAEEGLEMTQPSQIKNNIQKVLFLVAGYRHKLDCLNNQVKSQSDFQSLRSV